MLAEQYPNRSWLSPQPGSGTRIASSPRPSQAEAQRTRQVQSRSGGVRAGEGIKMKGTWEAGGPGI